MGRVNAATRPSTRARSARREVEVDQITRRTLLTRALVAGAGATVLGSFRDSAAAAVGADARSTQLPVIDPNFIAGRVVGSDRAGLVVQDPDLQLRRVSVGAASEVWREGVWGAGGLRSGDCIYARGSLQPDDTLVVDKAWVAIFNHYGTVQRASARSMDFVIRGGQEVSVSASPFVADFSSLTAGQGVQVIGFEGSSGELAATLVVPDLLDATPSPQEIAPDSSLLGVGSWQCCGGVNGCGSQDCAINRCCPPPSSHGACSTCRTDQAGVAWPHLTTGCVASCISCCFTPTALACGHIVTITNSCTNKSTNCPVNDCGPNARCVVANRCKGYQVVKWDLTACSFTAVGGNLDAGFIDSVAVF